MRSALSIREVLEGHESQPCASIFAPFLEQQGYDASISNALRAYLETATMQTLNPIVRV
jgi:type 1 glutamine amidotransferase